MRERFTEINSVFLAALRIDASEREAFVTRRCGDDAALMAEVLALLAEDAAATGALDRPALGDGVRLTSFARNSGHDAAIDGPLPKAIGQYRIVRRLGAGGMGVVYEAQQENPRRTVALKVINAGVASREMLRRFEHEAQVLGRLQHPGIAQIFEAGTFDSGAGAQPFFAMEFVQGESLMAYIARRNPSTCHRLKLLTRICEAVQHAHQRGVIHRDLKPGNVLIVDDPEALKSGEQQPKILDFGVARATDADTQSVTLCTDIGQLIGTVPYMSPEQAAGDPHALDTRSDVYALGVLAYEVLAERLPYDVKGKLVHEAVRIIREEEPAALSTINRVLAGDVQTIVSKALEKDKGRRYQSASALSDDISRYLNDEPISARRPSAAYQFSKFAKRNKPIVAAAAAIALAVIAGAVVSIRFGLSEAKAHRLAVHAGTIAEQRRVEVEQQSAVAQAVNDFINHDLLEAADPEFGDREITMRAALDSAAARIGDRFQSQPLVEAAIRMTLGTTYRNLGKHAAAAAQVEEALQLRNRALAADDMKVVDTEHLLATIYGEQSRYDEAKPLFEHALAQRRAQLGDEHPLTISSLNDLALWHKRNGDFQQARAMFTEALALQRSFGGDDHIDTLAIMTNLADVHSNLEEFDAAEPLFLEALERRRRVHGPDHPRTLSTLDGLAQLYVRTGDRTQARSMFQEVFDGREKALGPDHPDTLLMLAQIATLDAALGNRDQAIASLRQLLAARTQSLGPTHPDTLTIMHDLGSMLAADNLNEANTLLTASLDGRRVALGDDHPATLIAMNNLARIRTNLGSVDEAMTLYEEALPGLRSVFGPEHSNTLATAQNLANLYGRLGRIAEAETLWFEVIARLREADSASASLAMAMNNLAYLYMKDGRVDDAEPLMIEALAMQRDIVGDLHPATFSTMNNLASVYRQQQRFSKSAAMLGELVPLVRERLGPQHAALAGTILQWADVLLAADRADEAETALQEALTIYQATQSASGWQIAHTRVMMAASLAAQHRFKEAEPMMLNGYEGLRHAADSKPEHIQRAAEHLVSLYEDWNQPEKAEHWRSVLAGASPETHVSDGQSH